MSVLWLLHRKIICQILKDTTLGLELVSSSLKDPTSMAFIGPNDILITEKNTGTVQRILNGEILEEPLLDVNVNGEDERGLLGIAVSKNSTVGKTYVFLFYTEAEPGTQVSEGEDDNNEGRTDKYRRRRPTYR